MKLIIKKGTTSKLIQIFITDSSKTDGSGLTGLVYNTASLTAYYIREGAASATAITLATATVGTYTSGGFIEVDATNMPGIYELHPPDACLASGADQVILFMKGAANMAPLPLEIQLRDNTEKDVYDRIGAPALASIATDIARLQDYYTELVEYRLTTARAGYLDELAAANLPADIDAILADTNELQTNQNAWLTADITALALEASLNDIKGTGFVKDTHSLPQCITATGFAPPGEYDTQMGYIPSDLGDVPTGSELDAAHGAGSWEGIPGSTDWSLAERKQIRDALGVDGDKTNIADSRIDDDIKKHDNKITGLLM